MSVVRKPYDGETRGGYLPKVVPHETRGLVGHTASRPWGKEPNPVGIGTNSDSYQASIALPRAWARIDAALAQWPGRETGG